MASKQLLFKKPSLNQKFPAVIVDAISQVNNSQETRKGKSTGKTKPVIVEETELLSENVTKDHVDNNDSTDNLEYTAEVDPIILEDNSNDDSNENFNIPVDQNLTENDDLTD